jgi:hypothetical protein
VKSETTLGRYLPIDPVLTKNSDKSDKTSFEDPSDGVLSLLSSIFGDRKGHVSGAAEDSTGATVDSLATQERPMSPAEATE